jgi:hypothetical protein
MSQSLRCDACGTHSEIERGDDGWVNASVSRNDHSLVRVGVYPATKRVLIGDFCSYKCFLAALPSGQEQATAPTTKA